jgi:hypothetical protein
VAGTGATRALAAALTIAAVASVSACTSSKHTTPPTTSASPVAAATRWWSNSVVAAGSTVDATSPGAAAARLQPSRTDYCGMLKQTVESNTVLSGLHPGDTKLQTSAKAFVAEIVKVAPAAVQPAWQTLGPVIVSIVQSGAGSAATVGTAKNLLAAQTIASDAKSSCNVDLTKIITAATK